MRYLYTCIGILGMLSTLWGKAETPCPEIQLIQSLQQQVHIWQTDADALMTFNQQLVGHLEGHRANSPRLRLLEEGHPGSIRWPHEMSRAMQELASKWQAYQRLREQIGTQAQHIQQLAGEGIFLIDSGKQALLHLQRIRLLYEDARSLQGELVFLAGQLHRHHQTPKSPTSEAVAAELHALVVHGRVLLLALGTEVDARIQRAQQQLQQRIAQAESRQATLMSQLGGPASVNTLYSQALTQARTLDAAATAYLTRQPIPAAYHHMDPIAYHVNIALNEPYSHSSQSLVRTYNQILEHLAGHGHMPAVGELPRLDVLQPTWPEASLASDFTLAPPQNLVFLIDVSGSMRQATGLPRFQHACEGLVRALRPQDHVSLVTFAGAGRVVLPATSGSDKQRIYQSLKRLKGEGNTHIEEGFLTGYDVVKQQWSETGNNRLILITDGGFDILPELLREIETHYYQGVKLTVVYLGQPNERMQYRLQCLATVGGGNCVSIRHDEAAPQLIQSVQEIPGSF